MYFRTVLYYALIAYYCITRANLATITFEKTNAFSHRIHISRSMEITFENSLSYRIIQNRYVDF
jgi:hypothetical protein